MELIPAIDLIDGKCVRLVQGDYARQTTYSDNPLETAKRFEGAGLRRLHLVDLDGARLGKLVNLKVLEDIAAQTMMQVDFSGGIRADADLQKVFDAGAAWACIGSLAYSDPQQTTTWLERYGGDRLIIGADVKDERICIHGWQKETTMTVFELVEQYAGKIQYLMCTDISRDGMLDGPGLELYKSLRERFPKLQLIASGGVGSMEDVERLQLLGLLGVVVGKAIYEGRIVLC
ncbi:1-(5-phosphoribosyl)-5-[(5-phosphoribosylamino) methylideneamino] imidazole-4-carboxamide isomerase [Bacteroidia bacterium]|nr:1-(5-phosphoribosyl)-5-[(5-phosphoribosylamino) methylideneamino] imidazole-4-carboxamide isomerase [Bacteroidia bacterium]